MSISVLIVEDEPEFLRRLSEAVLSDPQLRLTGAVSTGQAARALIDCDPPQVLLVDLGLPDMNGIDLIRHVSHAHPQCDPLVITMFADDAHVMASLEAGATGYQLKDSSNERIAAAVHEIHEGGAPISPSIARRVLMRLRPAAPETGDALAPQDSPAASASSPSGSPLSERETQILKLIAKGLNFDTVGEVLSISPHTVVTHVKKIYRKLAVHSRGEAVYEARQLGLLS